MTVILEIAVWFMPIDSHLSVYGKECDTPCDSHTQGDFEWLSSETTPPEIH